MRRATIVKSWTHPDGQGVEYLRHHIAVVFSDCVDQWGEVVTVTYRVNVSRNLDPWRPCPGAWKVEASDLTISDDVHWSGRANRYGEEGSTYESFPHHSKACELALALAAIA